MYLRYFLLLTALTFIGNAVFAKAVAPLGLNFNAPTINDKSRVEDPKIGEIVYDYADSSFWGYRDSGLGWAQLGGGAASSTQSYEISNLSLVTSVSSNALTVAFKTQGGSDPTSGSPVKIGFRNATSSTGTYTQQTLTGALSLTVSSGSTLGCSSGAECPIFIYAVDSGSGIAIGVSRSLFDEGSLVSTTAEGGAGAADSAGVIYTSAAQSSKPVRLVGRIKITETTAGTWASNSTEVSTAPFSGATSFASSGYTRLPGGLIIQWTNGTASSGGNTTNWPIAFPNAVLAVSAQPVNGIAAVQAAPTTSGTTLTVSSGTPNCNIIGIGY